MAPKIPNPLGAPAELVKALSHLPAIAAATRSMSNDTELLVQVQEDMAEVARKMEGVTSMDAKMANIEATMPALVEIQRDLHNLPDVIAKLDDRIAALSVLLEELATAMEGLQGSLTPLGRLAGRLPGGKDKRESKTDLPTLDERAG